jgi:predicted alpha/beta-fold hydrolase
MFAVGYSLGAGILSKFVAEEGDRCPFTAAVACCASFDLSLSAQLLERPGINSRYNKYLAGNLVRFLQRHHNRFKDETWINLAAAYKATTVRQFDTATIVPMFGFQDAEDYYRQASSAHILEGVRIPLLMLNAADDPICSTAGVPLGKVQQSDYLASVITEEGGHVAWSHGWWPTGKSWENDAIAQYFSAALALTSHPWNATETRAALTDVINVDMSLMHPAHNESNLTDAVDTSVYQVPTGFDGGASDGTTQRTANNDDGQVSEDERERIHLEA